MSAGFHSRYSILGNRVSGLHCWTCNSSLMVSTSGIDPKGSRSFSGRGRIYISKNAYPYIQIYMTNTNGILICWEVLGPNFTQSGPTKTFIIW